MGNLVPRPTALVRLQEACRFLARCDLASAKELRDQAQAVAAYLRQQKHGLDAQNQAAEIKLRSERRLGELLAGTVNHAGSRGVGNTVLPTLPEGISKMQSSRWQREASVPPEEFERYLMHTREAGEELTSAGLLLLASQEGKARERVRRLRQAKRFRFEPDAEGIVTGDVSCLESRLEDSSVDLVLA